MSDIVYNKLILISSKKAKCSSTTHNLIVNKRKYKITNKKCAAIDKLPLCRRKINHINTLKIWPTDRDLRHTTQSDISEEIARYNIRPIRCFADDKVLNDYAMDILPEVIAAAYHGNQVAVFQISLTLYNTKAEQVNLNGASISLTDRGLTIKWDKHISFDGTHNPSHGRSDVVYFQNSYNNINVEGALAVATSIHMGPISSTTCSATVSISFFTDVIHSNTIKIIATPDKIVLDTVFGPEKEDINSKNLDLMNIYELNYDEEAYCCRGNLVEVTFEAIDEPHEKTNKKHKKLSRKRKSTNKDSKEAKRTILDGTKRKIKRVKRNITKNLAIGCIAPQLSIDEQLVQTPCRSFARQHIISHHDVGSPTFVAKLDHIQNKRYSYFVRNESVQAERQLMRQNQSKTAIPRQNEVFVEDDEVPSGSAFRKHIQETYIRNQDDVEDVLEKQRKNKMKGRSKSLETKL